MPFSQETAARIGAGLLDRRQWNILKMRHIGLRSVVKTRTFGESSTLRDDLHRAAPVGLPENARKHTMGPRRGGCPPPLFKMRRVWAAALALCAAADLRIETDVSLEVMMDDESRTLRARLDEDPAHAARAFCAAASVAVECEERVTKALRAEQDAVRARPRDRDRLRRVVHEPNGRGAAASARGRDRIRAEAQKLGRVDLGRVDATRCRSRGG